MDKPYTNDDWWPNRIDLRVLHANAPAGDPVDRASTTRGRFAKLDLNAVRDIAQVLTSHPGTPVAGRLRHHGGLMIRLRLPERTA